MSHLTLSASPAPSIAAEINAATKKLHIELNRLIVDRLPFGLPPHAQTPSRYAVGLSHFVAIFLSFEKALDNVALENSEDEPHKQEVARWVASLVPPALRRSTRLKADLAHLQKSTKAEIISAHAGDRTIGRAGKPHLLVAYTWIMYMAIFSGGRWIRQQLASAGDEFWLGHARSDKSLNTPGFTFLSFDENDGEDLKIAFKKKLAEADDLLTDDERSEIVAAGQELFQQCIDLINKVDRDVWWYESTSAWSSAYIVLALGFVWLIWRLCTGQSILTD